MRFVHAYLLLLLVFVPVLGGIAWALRRRAAERLNALSYCAAAQQQPRRVTTQLILILVGLALLIIALARPQWGLRDEVVMTRGRNVMLVVDVSRSMLATDVHPNRLERAKADLLDLIDVLQGDRAGLLAFRKKAVTVCPLTTDYAYLRQAIDYLRIDSAPRGETDIAHAIEQALQDFERAGSSHNAIVLISDGEDLAGRAQAAAKRAGERNIPIFTVGIGSAAGSTIPDEKGLVQFEGKTVETKLTETTLSEIAEISGGRYVPLATAGTAETTLGAIYRRHLRKLADQEQEEKLENQIQERYMLFLWPGILCFLAAGCLSQGRLAARARAVQHQVQVVAVMLIGLMVASAFADGREAQALFDRGAFAEAAKAYEEALAGAEAEQADRYAYNGALAAIQAEDDALATSLLQRILTSKTYSARANTLLGQISMRKAKALEDMKERLAEREVALSALLRAAQAAPEDEAAQQNLTRALYEIETLRRDVHTADVLKAHEKEHLGQLVPQLLARQRALMAAAPEVFASVKPEVLIRQAEDLAKRQKELSDLWIPVRAKLQEVVTNEQTYAEIATRIDSAREQMIQNAEAVADLSPVCDAINQSEPFIYDLWKGIADPPALNHESIAVLTNAMTSTKSYQPMRQDMPEVLQLIKQFKVLFPEWADQQIQQTASQTNAPPFTAEDKAKIEQLAQEAETAAQAQNKPVAMEALEKIRDLLPKQNNDQNQNQNQQQNQQDQKQEQQQQEQQQDQQQQEQKQEEQQAEEQEQKEQTPQDVQNLLQRTVDREREKEEEKDRRAAGIPIRPDERDW